jgi:hypothetical protein
LGVGEWGGELTKVGANLLGDTGLKFKGRDLSVASSLAVEANV